MELLVLPNDDLQVLLDAIDGAKVSIDITLFRLDWHEIETRLSRAVYRGVHVRALVAHTNRDDDLGLRRLEQRLLRQGITVARTDENLVRYHDKLMIVDRRILFVLGFNLTCEELHQNRSLGILTSNKALVQEACRLFQADLTRQPYRAGHGALVVSPDNARQRLASFLEGARRELLIYDPRLTDKAMLRLLDRQRQAGVAIRVMGRVSRPLAGVPVRQLVGLHLHVRAILRDGRQAFVGSQSLRRQELDARREVGIIVESEKVLRRLRSLFEADWSTAVPAELLPAQERHAGPARQDPERVAAREEAHRRSRGGLGIPECTVPTSCPPPLP